MCKTFLLFAFVWSALGQTGPAVPELASLDKAITGLLTRYEIPGVSVAIAKDGRLVYTRGFGVADRDTKEPVQPDSLFRVASVSKPITAVAVLKLVEDGKVTLDTRVLSFIGRKATADVRYNDITVRHLLQHSGGMDIEFWGFDPSFPDRKTLLALGASLPPTRGDILDFVLNNLPLAFAPGTSFAYSNVGFMFLTEVIEKASGQKYETYMREKILGPIGITRMSVGGSLLTERRPGEVRYWDKDRVDAPIFPGLPEEVLLPYGTFNLRIFESGGGWLASTPDLVRFLSAFDSASTYPILKADTAKLISTRPSFASPNADEWYGLGWQIVKMPNGELWGHNGALQGTSAFMFRGVNGVSFAIAANTLPNDEVLEAFLTEFEVSLSDTALAIKSWPAGNTFATYFPGQAPKIADAGVVNAASLRPGPVAAGSVVKLFGVNLKGTVRINGNFAETLWTEEGDLQVRVPVSASGPTPFQVDLNGQTSNRITVDVKPAAPAVFTVSRNGYGQAAALNQDGKANTLANPASAGSIVVLYATGVAPRPAVIVGGQAAEVLYSDQAPGLPFGIQQINILLPQTLKSGPQPVLIQSGAANSQSEVTLSIQ